jgi:hypothetical protein
LTFGWFLFCLVGGAVDSVTGVLSGRYLRVRCRCSLLLLGLCFLVLFLFVGITLAYCLDPRSCTNLCITVGRNSYFSLSINSIYDV